MKTLFGWVLILVLGSFAFFFLFEVLTYDYRWSQLNRYWDDLARGWGVTIAVSALALVISCVFAVILTLGQLSDLAPARWLAQIYVEVIRGTPLLTQILLGYYLIATGLNLDSRFYIGALLLSFFAGAYLSEIFRAGIESIPRSQLQAARAVGFTEAQTYRHVIVPQAVRRVLPATAGQFANLIKDSSLLSVIALQEFQLEANRVNAATFSDFAAYIPLAVGYLILTLPISLWSRRLERRFAYES